MNRLSMLLAASFIFALTGCEKDSATTPGSSTPPPSAANTTAKSAPHGHDHDHAMAEPSDVHEGEKHELGTQQAGVYTVKATQTGEIKPGVEVVFEIVVSGGTTKPTAVRAWVGSEDGQGSAKSKAEAGDKDYHAHIELPASIPANSKLWVELDTASGRQRASFNFPKEDDHANGKKNSHGV
jgi:hypothetical protein